MRKYLALLVVGFSLVAVAGGLSEAAVLGPFCWQNPPLDDLFALTFITDGGNTAAVAGRNVATNVAVSGAAFVEADGIMVNMVVTVGQASPTDSTFHMQTRFSNQTGAGNGRCQSVNPAATGGCGTSADIQLVFVACPVNALPQ